MSISSSTWDEQAHQQMLRGGWSKSSVFTTQDGKQGIYIDKRVSAIPGFGTASTREIMREYFSNGYTAGVHNQAAWTSHIFHLYMGMIPIDRQVGVVQTYFGIFGTSIIEEDLPSIQQALKDNSLTDEMKGLMSILKRMIYYARNQQLNAQEAKHVITEEDILNCTDELAQLNQQTVSYISHEFIPSVLRALEAHLKEKKEKHPNTSALTSVNMQMSDEGMKRWKEAIDQNKPFVPFRNLEHLYPYMDAAQRARLDKIIELRQNISHQKL